MTCGRSSPIGTCTYIYTHPDTVLQCCAVRCTSYTMLRYTSYTMLRCAALRCAALRCAALCVLCIPIGMHRFIHVRTL